MKIVYHESIIKKSWTTPEITILSTTLTSNTLCNDTNKPNPSDGDANDINNTGCS
jgi:hypothetical protein